MKGPSAAARQTTGLGTRSRISVLDSGSNVDEREVEGMREVFVTIEGGEVGSFLTGVVAVEVDILTLRTRAADFNYLKA